MDITTNQADQPNQKQDIRSIPTIRCYTSQPHRPKNLRKTQDITADTSDCHLLMRVYHAQICISLTSKYLRGTIAPS